VLLVTLKHLIFERKTERRKRERERERVQKNCGTMADDFKPINAATIPGGS